MRRFVVVFSFFLVSFLDLFMVGMVVIIFFNFSLYRIVVLLVVFKLIIMKRDIGMEMGVREFFRD